MASDDGQVSVSLTVGSPVVPGGVPRAPQPAGRLPMTGASLVSFLLALALLVLTIGLVLVHISTRWRQRRPPAGATRGVA